jgi:hypothetical protein
VWLTSLTVPSWRYERVSKTRTPGQVVWIVACCNLHIAIVELGAFWITAEELPSRRKTPRAPWAHWRRRQDRALTAKAPADDDHAANLQHDGEGHRGVGPELPAYRTVGETQNGFGRVGSKPSVFPRPRSGASFTPRPEQWPTGRPIRPRAGAP